MQYYIIDTMPTKRQPTIVRFNAGYKIDKNGCWIWQRSRCSAGYGSTSIPAKPRYHTVMAHRLSYELFKGKIPPHHHIHHICKVKLCVNPEHLKLMREEKHNGIHDNFSENNKERKARTHCPKGHPYKGNNLILSKENHRFCRTCMYAAYKKHYYKQHTKCSKGHPYTPENTRYGIDNGRICITCRG